MPRLTFNPRFAPAACVTLMIAAIVVGELSEPESLFAQPQAPPYEDCRLDSIFPIGGRQGTSVKVTFKGYGAGLTSPRDVIVDGPPGIRAKEIKSLTPSSVEAVLEIAPDAPLGRRALRILNEKSGLTNFAYFVVGNLPEQIEVEPNSDTSKAEAIQLPCVVDGRIDPAADRDLFRFRGRAGQRVVAAVAAHALDIHGQSKNYGIADFNLELLNAEGGMIVASEDAVGLDPIIDYRLISDGDYFIRVQLLNYGGFPEAVYRLTIGDVSYPVAAFPAGVRRRVATDVELFGPSVPYYSPTSGAKISVLQNPSTMTQDPAYPLRFVTPAGSRQSGLDIPLVVGDLPEIIEPEPNDDIKHSAPITINGRFEYAGDADWYRLTSAAGRKITAEVIAQRFLRSPVDTLVQVYDAAGTLLEENDDIKFEPGYESYHDFQPTDSKLSFTAATAGDYFIKISDQNGAGGPRAIYRLTLADTKPDFRLSHFPDGIPIWGPGSTACVLVRVDRFFDCKDDIEISVVDLPQGWSSSSAISYGPTPTRPYNTHSLKVFLTITAPADAAPGTCVPMRIIGRAQRSDGSTLEHGSLPLTLFYTSDTGFFRASPRARVAVAKPLGPWLETEVRELSVRQGESGTVAVRVRGGDELKSMPLVVNIATSGVACSLSTPQTLPIVDGIVEVPLKIPRELAPGSYGIVVAQSWRSDIRIGMPGPCTPLIKLTVEPAK